LAPASDDTGTLDDDEGEDAAPVIEMTAPSSQDGPQETVGPAETGPSLTDPVDAWSSLMEKGDGLPPGMRPFLKAAVVSLSEDGALIVELPDGPGLERLREQTALRAIQGALAVRIGETPEIVVRVTNGPASSTPERITPETVRSDRLRELIQREPLLQQAVEELDLELFD